jgi:hypothetical protein
MAMRPLVIILAITSATFAGTTVYLARELAIAREPQSPPAILTTRPGAASPPMRAVLPQQAWDAVAKPVGAEPGPKAAERNMFSVASMSEADMKRMQLDSYRNLLERLDDPQGREEMRAQHGVMYRQIYPRLDKYLGLSSDEYSRLMNVMADQQIGMQEKSARCGLDPQCDMANLTHSGDAEAREISEILGADRATRFETYKNTMSEREGVTQLRTRLTDNSRLADAAAEGLINALAEERGAIHREAAARGDGMYGFGMGSGMLFAPSEGNFETRYEAARQNSQRLRDRAAQHLNSEQMRTFNEMQDELLLGLRGQLRNKDTIHGATAVTITNGYAVGDRIN